ncbi:hypothetical protein ACFLR0_02685 [Candidatus Bipolaricaulota bacterium]
MPGPPLNWYAILACTPVLLVLRLMTTPRRSAIEGRRDLWIDRGYGLAVSFVYSWLLTLAIASARATTFLPGLGYGVAAYVGIRLASSFFYAGFAGARTVAWWLRTGVQLTTYGLLGGMLAVWR